MATSRRNNKKKKIIKVRDAIVQNVGSRIKSPEFYRGEHIPFNDQSKLDFIHFVNQHVDEFFAQDIESILGVEKEIDKIYEERFNKLKAVNRYSYADPNQIFRTPPRKDLFELEKSFRAYRYLYPAQEVIALEPNHYHLFKSVRTSLQNREEYEEDIEPENIVSFSENTKAVLEDGCDYLDVMQQKYDDRESRELMRNCLILLQEMHDEVDLLCGKRFMGDEDLNQKTILTFGYAAFASKHLQEDENIDLEKRCFLIEQTSRVLHYLCE